MTFLRRFADHPTRIKQGRTQRARKAGWLLWIVLLIAIPSLSAQTETPRAPATFAVPATSTPRPLATLAVPSTPTPAAPATFAFPAPPSNAGDAPEQATAESTIDVTVQPTIQATSSVAVFDVPPGRYEGQIDSATPAVRYRLTLQAGQIVLLTMDTTSGDLDPFLLLFDESETLLASNDDVEVGNRSAQIAFTIPIEGTYLIEASRFNQDANAGRGTYVLTIDVAGEGSVVEPNDPLSVAPPFNVDYSLLDYEQFGTGGFDEVNQTHYFALGGQKGDFVRLVITAVPGSDLVPTAAILDSDLTIISRIAQQSERELTLYAALPQTGWYLIEVGRESGRGDFIAFASRAADSILELGTPIERTFTRDRNVFSFIFTATIGDRIFASATADAPDAQLEVTIFDLNQNALSSRQVQSDRVRIPSLVIPRSGPYIIQVRENGTALRTNVSLDVRGIPVDLTKLNAIPAAYNERYTGTISNEKPVDYYRLVGKAGELVTLSMATSEGLDSYLILADASLNELTFNDNVGVSGNARITQFTLPSDGEYFILATRSGLSRGTTQGPYTLDITVGEITLQQGAFSVTLRWEGEADLNLFVRLPDGQIVSWSNPTVDGAQLQIDSNTNCTTPTAQPVEHIMRPGADLPEGDYTVWVWYQNVCSARLPASFSLEIKVRDKVLLTLVPQQNPLPPAVQSPVLLPDQRFETVFRVGRENTVLVSTGSVSSPSPQQRASQGGDTAIFFGQPLTGTLNDEIFAQFYQFQGQEGETVTIRAERLTGDLDPIVVLRDAADNNLATNDDASAGTSNSELTFTLPASGRYTIAVTRFGLRDGTTRGDYRVVIERKSPGPAGEG